MYPVAAQAIDFISQFSRAGQDKATCAISLIILPGHESAFYNKIISTLNKYEQKLRPCLPALKDDTVWDYDMVLDELRSWPKNADLTLMQLSQKTTMLLLLCTSRRHIDIANTTLNRAERTPSKFTFILPRPNKTYTPEHFAQQKITITRFHDRKVCPYITLCHYVDRTATLRDSNKLFITTTTYTAAAAGTISRWVKCLMEKSGVDVSKFTPHTTRAASVSKHAQFSKSLTDILKLGHWRSTSSFFRHYLRTPENTNIKSPTPTKNC